MQRLKLIDDIAFSHSSMQSNRLAINGDDSVLFANENALYRGNILGGHNTIVLQIKHTIQDVRCENNVATVSDSWGYAHVCMNICEKEPVWIKIQGKNRAPGWCCAIYRKVQNDILLCIRTMRKLHIVDLQHAPSTTLTPTNTVDLHNFPNAVVVVENNIVCVAEQNEISLWDTSTRECVKRVDSRFGNIYALCMCERTKNIFAGSSRSVCVFDSRKQCLRAFWKNTTKSDIIGLCIQEDDETTTTTTQTQTTSNMCVCVALDGELSATMYNNAKAVFLNKSAKSWKNDVRFVGVAKYKGYIYGLGENGVLQQYNTKEKQQEVNEQPDVMQHPVKKQRLG